MNDAVGALAGLRVIEIAGIGPCPFAAMLLADMGAQVTRIDRVGGPTASFAIDPAVDILSRNRRSIAVNLKSAVGRDIVLSLCRSAAILIEGFRPGVMERLGLGPEQCLQANPALVYGRATGWGQTGPLAETAGHDVNFIALSGCLFGMGRAHEPPTPPLNLVGDYGAGAMFLVAGVLAAVICARESGRGQVVDAAIVDGAALFMSAFMGLSRMGLWREERAANLLDSGAYFYDCYATRDGKYLSIGALEPKFFAEFVKGAGLDPHEYTQQPERWPVLRDKLAHAIARRDRDEWAAIFAGSDACVAPVLSLSEAARHPHNAARAVFVERFGLEQPAPAPRFGNTPSSVRLPPPLIGEHTRDILAELGYSAADIETIIDSGECAAQNRNSSITTT